MIFFKSIGWLRRFRELVDQNGLLVIQSIESKYKPDYLIKTLDEFDLISEKSLTGKDSLTVWKKKSF